jgi:hypothetical protein
MPVFEFAGDCHISMAVAGVCRMYMESPPTPTGIGGLFIGLSFVSDYCTPFLMT